MSVRRCALVLVAVLCVSWCVPDMASAHAARAAGPAAQWNPATYTFPDTYAETRSASHTFTLTSTGTQPLVISGKAFLQGNDPDLADSFFISASTCDNATLDPGDT